MLFLLDPAESGRQVSCDMTNILSSLRTWAEIDLEAIRANVRQIKQKAGTAGVMAIVKANAYGHGVERVCLALDGEEVDFFGIANMGEARRIQATGCTRRLFILGPTFPGEREEIVRHGWTAFITAFEEARHFDELACRLGIKASVHIALNSGMGRGGFLPDFLCEHAREFLAFKHLEIEGLASHLPVADEDEVFTREQIKCFTRVCESVDAVIPLKYKHLSNSVGVMDYEITSGNLVRPGLVIYGISPLPGHERELKPACVFKSRVTAVQTLPPGQGVSYGRDFITTAETRVATVGVGYADGYPRQLSGKGAHVWLRGQRCPLLGRVTMDQIMVDVSALDEVASGDEVELFGPHIPIADIARMAGTIVWDIFTGMSPRVTRIYKGE